MTTQEKFVKAKTVVSIGEPHKGGLRGWAADCIIELEDGRRINYPLTGNTRKGLLADCEKRRKLIGVPLTGMEYSDTGIFASWKLDVFGSNFFQLRR